MTTAQALFNKYRSEITQIISVIQTQKEAAIPAIIADITTKIIPQMMVDVGVIRALSGDQKKQLIIDAIDLAVTEVFKELNAQIPELAAASWDETVRDSLLTVIPPTINLLISVDNGQLKFNKKLKCFACCK